jgi:hypothetical protein
MVRACPDGDAVYVHVKDTGGGISEAAQARLFEPFFTTKPRERGTGLGLVISAEIVRAHGGELRLVETSPAGSTFEVRLPLEIQRDAVASGVPHTTVPPVIAGAARPRVLLIDDEAQLLAAYRRLLANEYDVHVATSGREAMDRLLVDTAWDVNA